MKKRIWVLEDDRDIADIIGFILSDEGYEIKIFNNANAIKQVMSNIDADLLITDVMLPDGNGFDVCLELQRVHGFKQPVLMMSANRFMSDVPTECIVTDFISKPFDIDKFVAKVREILQPSLPIHK